MDKPNEAHANYELERSAAHDVNPTELKWEAVSHYVRTVRGLFICDCGANVPGNAEMAGYIAETHNATLGA